MWTSAPGICKPRCRGARGAVRRCAGFTLVEILVTIVIIAIGSAVAVVAWQGDPRVDAEREARRFAGALEYAAARAQARHQALGVQAEEDGRGWRFWQRNDAGAWVPVASDDVLAPRRLAEGLVLAPRDWAGRPVEAGEVLPLRASGRNEPFAFVLHEPGHSLTIAFDPLNRATISRNAAS